MNANTDPRPDVIHPKHIMAPVDFSEPCLHGFHAALDLASRTEAKLTLVRVVRHAPCPVLVVR